MKILIADDRAENRELLERFFRHRNICITQAVNFEETLVKAEQEKPDLILLDLTFQEQDAVTTMKRTAELKNISPESAILICSSWPDLQGITKSAQADNIVQGVFPMHENLNQRALLNAAMSAVEKRGASSTLEELFQLCRPSQC